MHGLHAAAVTGTAGTLEALRLVGVAGSELAGAASETSCYLAAPVPGEDRVLSHRYAELMADLRQLGMSADELAVFCAVLASVRRLGALSFAAAPDGRVQAQPAAVVHAVAELLGLPPAALSAVLTDQQVPGDESASVPRSAAQAAAMRDELAQMLFGWLVSWVCAAANKAMAPKGKCAAVHLVQPPPTAIFSRPAGPDALYANLVAELMQMQVFANCPVSAASRQSHDRLVEFLFSPASGLLPALTRASLSQTQNEAQYQLTAAFSDSSYFRLDGQSGFVVSHSFGPVTYALAAVLRLVTWTPRDAMAVDALLLASTKPAIAGNAAQQVSLAESLLELQASLQPLSEMLAATNAYVVRCMLPSHPSAPAGMDRACIEQQLRGALLLGRPEEQNSIQGVQVGRQGRISFMLLLTVSCCPDAGSGGGVAASPRGRTERLCQCRRRLGGGCQEASRRAQHQGGAASAHGNQVHPQARG